MSVFRRQKLSINNRRRIRNYATNGRLSNTISNFSDEVKETFSDGIEYVKGRTVSYIGNPFEFRGNRLRALCGFSSSLIILPFSGGLSMLAASYGAVKAYQAMKDRRAI